VPPVYAQAARPQRQAGGREVNRLKVGMITNQRFQTFLIQLKREQSDIGKVFVNE
jgi:hypothetical protein